MSDKNDLSEEDLFGDLDLQPSTNQTVSPPPVLTEIANQKPISAPLPEATNPSRFKPQTQAFKQPPPRNLTGLWILLSIIFVLGGGGVAVMYFLQLGPFATDQPIQHTVFSPPPRAKPQTVVFKSTPPGASIEINGTATKATTPHTFQLKHGKNYKFKLKLKGHVDLTHELKIKKAGKPIYLDLKLVAGDTTAPATGPKGVLFVQCWPIGATVNFGNKDRGKCGKAAVRIEIVGGTHPTKISFPGYDSYTQPIKVPGEEVVYKKIVLEKTLPGARKKPVARRGKTRKRPVRRRVRGFGRLSIACTPPADVFWRGKKIGTTPLTHKFPAGRQRLVLKGKSIRASKRLSVYVKPRKVTSKKVSFRKGRIKFIVRPWADVYINGKKIGQTPIPPASVYEGYYSVELRNKKARKKFRVRVQGGQTYPVFHAFP